MLSLKELQEDLLKAAGFIVGDSRKTWKTGPSFGASPENPELATRRSWIVEHGCVCATEIRAQAVIKAFERDRPIIRTFGRSLPSSPPLHLVALAGNGFE